MIVQHIILDEVRKVLIIEISTQLKASLDGI